MISLIAHGLLAVAVVVLAIRANPAIFRRPASGPLFSRMELVLYAIGIASIAAGWSFNITFVLEYTEGIANNPLWGDGSWAHYMRLIFDNPASGSAAIDFSIANVLLLPVVTIVDGRRRGINKPWLFFVTTLFASFTFGWAFYAATVERQRRLGVTAGPATEVVPAQPASPS